MSPQRWAYFCKGIELRKKHEAEQREQDFRNLQWLFAWQTAFLLNISGKSVKAEVTPAMLMGEPEPQAEKKEAEPLQQEDFDELLKHIGKIPEC